METLIDILVGVVLPFIYNKIKGWLGWSDRAALWGAAVAALLGAIFVKLALGELDLGSFSNPEDLFYSFSVIFALATLVFKQFKDKFFTGAKG